MEHQQSDVEDDKLGESENIGQTATTVSDGQHLQYIHNTGERNITQSSGGPVEADTSQTKRGYKPEYFRSLKSLNSLLEMLENGNVGENGHEQEPEKLKVKQF